MADDADIKNALAAFRENPKFLQPHEYVEDKYGVCSFCGEGMLHVWYSLFRRYIAKAPSTGYLPVCSHGYYGDCPVCKSS